MSSAMDDGAMSSSPDGALSTALDDAMSSSLNDAKSSENLMDATISSALALFKVLKTGW